MKKIYFVILALLYFMILGIDFTDTVFQLAVLLPLGIIVMLRMGIVLRKKRQ